MVIVPVHAVNNKKNKIVNNLEFFIIPFLIIHFIDIRGGAIVYKALF